ncbi:MAG: hypothetical protein IAE77_23130 [Prosthecobacter sp.]|nr:hypothetical protein [Prosthecobacter sp.]
MRESGDESGWGIRRQDHVNKVDRAIARTAAELTDAIADTVAGSSANSNSVDFLGSSAPPDYDPWVIQALIDKLNELIAALRRAGA